MELEELFNEFDNGSMEDRAHKRLVEQMLKHFFQQKMTDEAPEDSPFTEVYPGYVRRDDTYFLKADTDDGCYILLFNQDASYTAFDVNDEKRPCSLPAPIKRYLRGISKFVNDYSTSFLRNVIQSYTSEDVYGNEEYLEVEWESFLKTACIKTGHEDAADHMTFPVNYKGRIREYLIENGGNPDHIHIV